MLPACDASSIGCSTAAANDGWRWSSNIATGLSWIPAPRQRRGWPTTSVAYDARMARLNYSRLSDRLLAGAMPHSAEHVATLHDEGVQLVINLCEEREYWVGEREAVLSAYGKVRIRELHLPVKDGATIPPGVIDAAVKSGASTVAYVHCRGGRERSATVATALLAREQQLSIDQAMALARAGRPVFCPLPWQMAGLQAWAANIT